MKEVPEDWVLREAAKRAWYAPATIDHWRAHHASSTTFSALCDMIAKYEQPPVDPDVEAVKRILQEWYGFDPLSIVALASDGGGYARAVAQYKLERAAAEELRVEVQGVFPGIFGVAGHGEVLLVHVIGQGRTITSSRPAGCCRHDSPLAGVDHGRPG